MTVGRIGKAVCRLISAPKAVPIMRREMSRDPAFALDDNPNCADCVRYRGKIKASRLAAEDFKLTAPLWAVDGDTERVLAAIQGEGISLVELHANRLDLSNSALDGLAKKLEEYGCTVPIVRAQMRSPESMGEVCAAAARLGARYVHVPAVQRSAQRSRWVEELGGLAAQADSKGLAVLLSNRRGSLVESAEELSAAVRDVGHPSVFAGYDPAEIALAGGSAFYTTGLYKGPLRRCTRHVDLRDVVIEGARPAVPGRGNAQIKEIISNLRCRSYDGTFCLWPMPEEGIDGFRTAARGFWEIMDSI